MNIRINERNESPHSMSLYSFKTRIINIFSLLSFRFHFMLNNVWCDHQEFKGNKLCGAGIQHNNHVVMS